MNKSKFINLIKEKYTKLGYNLFADYQGSEMFKAPTKNQLSDAQRAAFKKAYLQFEFK